MRKQGKTQLSLFWSITSAWDGLVKERWFHKSYIHTGTLEKTYLSKMDLLQKVSDFSCLPPYVGKCWNKSMKDTRGMKKCMVKARKSMFLPGIGDDIWESVEKCGICQSFFTTAKPVEDVGEVPPHMWHTLGTDLFYWNKQNLVAGDFFSKYLLVRKNPNTSTHSVIKELGMIFTEFGCPFMLKNVKGLCYTSREFHDFLEFYRIHHITSSPHHPQSNGFAEALLGISKNLMEKSVKDGKPWNHGLLKYRVTPVSRNLPSPLETLTGCRLRTSLPQILSSIGKSVQTSKIWQELIKRQPSTSSHYSMELKPGPACFHERSAWKCMENWCDWLNSNGTWIILGEVSWQFHTEKDKINDQALSSTFLFWIGSWRQKMEQYRTYSTIFSPSLQPKSPSTRDTSFASGQSGSTSFDKQGYTACTGKHSCQFPPVWINLPPDRYHVPEFPCSVLTTLLSFLGLLLKILWALWWRS